MILASKSTLDRVRLLGARGPAVLLPTKVDNTAALAAIRQKFAAGGPGSGRHSEGGYTIHHTTRTDSEGNTRHKYDIYLKDGKLPNEQGYYSKPATHVGHAELTRDGKSAMSVGIHPEHQRQGYATALYKHIEEDRGIKLQPNKYQTDEGQEFWKSRVNAGGAGSGCHGDNCGRPPSAHELGAPKEAHSFLKNTGWTHAGMAPVPGKEALKTGTKHLYVHPDYGKLWVGKKNYYYHNQTTGKIQKGSLVKGIKPLLKDLSEKGAVKPMASPPAPKKEYPATPKGVDQDVHEHLTDQGFSFAKYGGKTGSALYNNEAGQSIYVNNGSKFEHYPMGATSYNSLGSSKGEGLSAIKIALSTPFDKAASSYTPSEPVVQTPKKSSLSTPNYPVLENVPNKNEFFGSPSDHVVVSDKFTSEEKATVASYKGSGSTSINKWSVKLANNDLESGEHSLTSAINNLESAIMKGRTKADMEVFRGVSGDYAKQLLETLKIGDTHKPASFQETSTKQSISHGNFSTAVNGLVFRISVPKGTPVLAAEMATTSHQGEYGMIFSRNVEYTVNKVYASDSRVYMAVTLKHPGITSAFDLSTEQYAKLFHRAAQLGFTEDQINMALTTVKDKDGRDITPLKCKLLRRQLAS